MRFSELMNKNKETLEATPVSTPVTNNTTGEDMEKMMEEIDSKVTDAFMIDDEFMFDAEPVKEHTPLSFDAFDEAVEKMNSNTVAAIVETIEYEVTPIDTIQEDTIMPETKTVEVVTENLPALKGADMLQAMLNQKIENYEEKTYLETPAIKITDSGFIVGDRILKNLQGYIIKFNTERVCFNTDGSSPEKGKSPFCFSKDSISAYTPERQGTKCNGCPYAALGSHPKRKGVPCCSKRPRLYLYLPEIGTAVFSLNMSYSSLKPITKMLRTLQNAGVPYPVQSLELGIEVVGKFSIKTLSLKIIQRPDAVKEAAKIVELIPQYADTINPKL